MAVNDLTGVQMGSRTFSRKERAALRILGNQYAFIDADEDDSERLRADTGKLSPIASTPVQIEMMLPQPNEVPIPPHVRHPYARIGDEPELEFWKAAPSTRTTRPSVRAKARVTSKLDFERESRRIFGGYMPQLEKGGLRPEYRAFISRNAGRPGTERFRLLDGLRKYDLGGLGLQSMFNRERMALTEEKLLKLEMSLRKDEEEN